MDFACKRFSIEEVIKCGLSLTKADYKILEFFVEKQDEEFTTDEIAKELGLNLTTIQRGVKKLFDSSILERNQKNLAGGGYVFYYNLHSKSRVRKVLMDVVHSWVNKVDQELKKW